LDSDGFPVFSYPSESGVYVTSDTALYSSAVFSCVNLLSSVIASLPLILYERKSPTEVFPAVNEPLYELLLFKPNTWQTAYDYWLWNMECILLRGGFISYINRSKIDGEILSLIPLHPDTVTIYQDRTGRLYMSGMAAYGLNNYMVFDKTPQENFFWANYRTLDSVTPVSPIRYAANTIGLDLTALDHGSHVFKNDATPPIVVTSPQVLDEKGLMNYAKMWKAGGNKSNYGMPRFLDKGADIKRLSMSNEDAQYLQTRRFQKEDTLNPYLTNIEQAINRTLIPQNQWGKIFADFNTKTFMRANTDKRIRFYKGLYDMNSITPNEIRHLEGMNPLEENNANQAAQTIE
jgi:HK97 family phage portal protein